MINVLVTGAGSVMGQSVAKALSASCFAAEMTLSFCNSEASAAGFYLSRSSGFRARLGPGFLVPVARSDEYLPAIRGLVGANDIDLVFGGTEHEIYQLSELREEPEFTDRVVALPLGVVRITADKLECARFFTRHGISGPLTDSYQNRKRVVEKRGYPVVMKPRSSSASRNVFMVERSEDFERYRFDAPERIVVQEYVGNEDGEYTVGCYLDFCSGSVSTIIMRRRLAGDGASLCGEVVEDAAIEEYCKSIVQAMMKEGLGGGPVNVQLRLCREGPQCFEINGRFSSTEAPRAALGFNSPEAAVWNLIRKEPYPRFAPHIGSGFIRFYEELYYSAENRIDPIPVGQRIGEGRWR